MVQRIRSSLVLGVVLAGCLVSLLPGCSEKSKPTSPIASNQRSTIYTTFYPTAYFAQRIVGNTADVVCPVPQGEDPILWRPSRKILAEYQKANLIIVNGAEFEKWIATASLPLSRMVDTAAAFADEFITFDSMTHSHGVRGDHTHEGIDGHTWVDPMIAKRQASAIVEAIVARDPTREAMYRKNIASLASDLDALDERMRELQPALARVTILASHPAYNYLARRYGFEIVNLDLDPKGALGESSAAIVRDAVGGAGGAAIILWESEPNESIVSELKALSVESILFSPCELLGDDERAAGFDYMSVMNANIDRLAAAIEG